MLGERETYLGGVRCFSFLFLSLAKVEPGFGGKKKEIERECVGAGTAPVWEARSTGG